MEPFLGLPPVGQLGFVVEDIRDSLPEYASSYNIKSWFEPKYAEKHFQIGGEEIELDLNLVFGYTGKLQVELIEEKSRRSPLYRNFLERYGPGLHHLGFYVPDLLEKLRGAHQLGLEVLQEGQFETAGGGSVRFAYLDTQQISGTIIELIDIKLYGLNVPQTEFMMNFARLTGDTRKFEV
ncbi:MAG: VOC family protein [Chloroflexota bacterium]|nr:MAG: VOC family protein [Chloroflexota bacterium]